MSPRETNDANLFEAREMEKCIPANQFLETLETVHFNNFENLLNAMESFLEGFEICDHTLDFHDISKCLEQTADSLKIIDSNCDGAISYSELLSYANKHAEARSQLQWLLCHFQALSRASLLKHDGKLHVEELATAARVFHGLAFIHSNFDALVKNHCESRKIFPQDLVDVLRNPNALSVGEARGIWYLLRYLLKLSCLRGTSAFSEDELETLNPEKLWLDPS